MSGGTILVVEDDRRTQQLIVQILEKEGYKTRTAASTASAYTEVQRLAPSLIVLDRKLSDGDGLALCKRLRADERHNTLPVLFLSAKDTTTDKVVGLEVGGDDYLTKPFQSEELLARIQALLRRAQGESESTAKTLQVHGITLDCDRHQCVVGKKIVRLWPKEWELLQTFLERPGRLLSKEFLSERVWEHEWFANSRALDITVQRLRYKLGPKGRLIETVKGYGYQLQAER